MNSKQRRELLESRNFLINVYDTIFNELIDLENNPDIKFISCNCFKEEIIIYDAEKEPVKFKMITKEK